MGEAHGQDPGLIGLEVRAWTQAVIALWQRVHAARTHPPPTPEQWERGAQGLLCELQALGAQFVEQLGHPCRALAWRLWHFQHELLTCVRQPEVPPDNNTAERAIRPLVIVRKISGGRAARAGPRPVCASPPSPAPGAPRASIRWTNSTASSDRPSLKSEQLRLHCVLTLSSPVAIMGS